MNYLQFEKSLKEKKIAPLYVLTGKEEFLKRQAIRLMKSRLGEDRLFFKEYSVDAQFNPRQLLSDLYSEALFDDFNLIILHHAQSIASRLYEPLSQYLQQPPAHSSLIIEMEKLDQKTKFAQLIKKKGTLVECEPLRQNVTSWQKEKGKGPEVIQWIHGRASFYQKQIASPAAYMLLEFIGNGLSDLDSQIQKLSLFIKERPVIEAPDVETIVKASRRIDIFNLMDAISSCDVRGAIKMLHLLFDRGSVSQDGQIEYNHANIALQFLRLFHYRLRQLWKISVSRNPEGVPEFARRKLTEHARHFPREKLVRIWKQTLQTEMTIKGAGKMPPRLAVEQLVLFAMQTHVSAP